MKKNTLKNKAGTACALLTLLAGTAHSDVEFHPKVVGASVDYGEIKKGKVGGEDWNDQTLTRTSVYLTTSATVDKKLGLFMTIGGLFWYPIHPGESTPERLVRFGPGVGQAQGIYSFGDPEHPSATVQFGLFPEKYNPDATNLGEYLFRSGTYPGTLITGGWSYLNSANYLAQGAHFTLPTFDGKVTHELTVFMERDYEPTSDFSPGYLITVKPGQFLELGAGLEWAHALSLNPDRLSPDKTHDDTINNGYSKVTKMPLRGATDPATLAALTTPGQIGFYTFRGFKAMGRVSLNFGDLLGWDPQASGDFKLYSEIALLGIEDQPYYYDKKSERMPIMAGLTVPTFGILDKLDFEVEYHKSRFHNTVGAPFYYSLPIPLDDDGTQDNPYRYDVNSYPAAEQDSVANALKKDDWHWSVYASRKIVQGISISGQVASDHQRHPTGPEVKPSVEPPTLSPKDWYYVVRLDFGLF
jgi:hypothetical protein